MKKIFAVILAIFFISNISYSKNIKEAYFAGGCFWCVEEYLDKIDGVSKTISGYSGGHLENPTYKQVVSNLTGHVEAVEVTYDVDKVNYSKLVSVHLKNINPFDGDGQFCDRGESYKPAIFYTNNYEKKIIIDSLMKIEKEFKRKTNVAVIKFKKFYRGEDYHQDYYQKSFINYLIYKSGCGREQKLNEIWNY